MEDKQNDGKAIEKKVGKLFKGLMDKQKAVVVRLHDTKSAAFFLPPSAGDFMGVAFGRPILIECKSSDVKHSFKECNLKSYVKPTQFAYHKLWVRQGGVSLFIFHSVPMDSCEVWMGESVLQAYSGGDKLLSGGISCDFSEKSLTEAITTMVTMESK